MMIVLVMVMVVVVVMVMVVVVVVMVMVEMVEMVVVVVSFARGAHEMSIQHSTCGDTVGARACIIVCGLLCLE